MPSENPITKTTGNSSPFAAWIVISFTASRTCSVSSPACSAICCRNSGRVSCSPKLRSNSSAMRLNSIRFSYRSSSPSSRMYFSYPVSVVTLLTISVIRRLPTLLRMSSTHLTKFGASLFLKGLSFTCAARTSNRCG